MGELSTGTGRCVSETLVFGHHWKRCIRERNHVEEDPRHVWLESFDVVGRIPVLVTWTGPRSTEPITSSVLTPRDTS